MEKSSHHCIEMAWAVLNDQLEDYILHQLAKYLLTTSSDCSLVYANQEDLPKVSASPSSPPAGEGIPKGDI